MNTTIDQIKAELRDIIELRAKLQLFIPSTTQP